MTISFEEIMQAVARGWCTPANEHKAVDPVLAEAIAIEVYTLPHNHLNGEPEEPLERDVLTPLDDGCCPHCDAEWPDPCEADCPRAFLGRVARLDPRLGPMDITSLVADARALTRGRMSDPDYYCDACGRNLTPTAEELQALSRWGNPLRRPPCLETESGYHLVDDEQITERQFADLVREYPLVTRGAKECTCGWPKQPCLRVVLRNGPPFPPPPCERRAALSSEDATRPTGDKE